MKGKSGKDDLMPERPSPFGRGRPLELQGPVRLQTLIPLPRAEGEPIPEGTELVAGARIAKAIWHPELAGLVHEYGPSTFEWHEGEALRVDLEQYH